MLIRDMGPRPAKGGAVAVARDVGFATPDAVDLTRRRRAPALGGAECLCHPTPSHLGPGENRTPDDGTR